MPVYLPKDEYLELAGREDGPSEWLVIDQERIDRFAEVTEDRQFIHIDPDRAARTPFGGTIAHGFLTLSLLPRLAAEHSVLPEGLRMAINYGLDRLRFLHPVRSGARVRLRSKVLDVTERAPGRLLVSRRATIEIEGEERPALTADTLTLFVVD